MLSLSEVRRILDDSGTDILVTDKAVFERTIVSRDALNVRTWIQSDDEPETLDGFLRAPNGDPQAESLSRPRPSIRTPPSPSFTPPAPADFQKVPLFPAAPCSAAAPPPYLPGCSSPTRTWL